MTVKLTLTVATPFNTKPPRTHATPHARLARDATLYTHNALCERLDKRSLYPWCPKQQDWSILWLDQAQFDPAQNAFCFMENVKVLFTCGVCVRVRACVPHMVLVIVLGAVICLVCAPCSFTAPRSSLLVRIGSVCLSLFRSTSRVASSSTTTVRVNTGAAAFFLLTSCRVLPSFPALHIY